jgi:hypothetical protein
MEYSQDFTLNVNKALDIIKDIIFQSEKIEGVKFDIFYVFRDGLIELSSKIENKKDIDLDFMNKWKPLMGRAHRIFEDHPLLDLLYEINNIIKGLPTSLSKQREN